MTQNHVPFRYDYVGSFLRPEKLKVAREKFQNNEITQEELKKVEDYYILDLIEKQKKAGYHTITDGEFRRGWWHLDFFWGLNGISFQKSSQGLRFHDEETKAETAVVVGKISGENHPFVEHYKFVKAQEDENTIAKQTIPSPAQLLIQLRLPEFISETREYYPTDDALKADIVKAYQTVIQELYAAGCRNLQLDDCTWTLYADRAFWKIFNITEESLRLIAEEEIAINNAAIANHPEDMVITTHVCRGNFHSTYASEGAYDPIAPYLFAREDVDAFYLEYDDARSGGFEPLKYIPEGKKVVLGLITTKSAELEDKNRIIRRIHDAARYVPLENLYLSPQCGFASTEEGNKLTEEEQWAKLALVKEIAESVWVTKKHMHAW
jgi:hypothetical protein